jgi:hypothetical protein
LFKDEEFEARAANYKIGLSPLSSVSPARFDDIVTLSARALAATAFMSYKFQKSPLSYVSVIKGQ